MFAAKNAPRQVPKGYLGFSYIHTEGQTLVYKLTYSTDVITQNTATNSNNVEWACAWANFTNCWFRGAFGGGHSFKAKWTLSNDTVTTGTYAAAFAECCASTDPTRALIFIGVLNTTLSSGTVLFTNATETEAASTSFATARSDGTSMGNGVNAYYLGGSATTTFLTNCPITTYTWATAATATTTVIGARTAQGSSVGTQSFGVMMHGRVDAVTFSATNALFNYQAITTTNVHSLPAVRIKTGCHTSLVAGYASLGSSGTTTGTTSSYKLNLAAMATSTSTWQTLTAGPAGSDGTFAASFGHMPHHLS